jgi:hypothetical protein
LDVATTPSLSISGLGHVPLLVSMMTGAQSLGVEVQAAYVASARKCAQSLRLSRVQFIAQDARHADLSRGTMFYLYSPFKGSILADAPKPRWLGELAQNPTLEAVGTLLPDCG